MQKCARDVLETVVLWHIGDTHQNFLQHPNLPSFGTDFEISSFAPSFLKAKSNELKYLLLMFCPIAKQLVDWS